MALDWPLVLLILLLGPVVGSFLGVLVDRLARGQGPWRASVCEACGARLGPRDLVPILSGLLLKGRCRSCGAAIPGHLLRIEIAGLVASLIALILAQGPLHLWVMAGFLWCLVGLFYSDLLSFLLPDPLTAALFLAGMGLALLDPARGLADGVLSAAVGSCAFLAIRLAYQALRGAEGLGLGDVKMMAGIGAGLGWEAIPLVTLLAAAMALAVVAIDALWHRRMPVAAARLPFGCYLAGGTVLALLL